MAVALTVAFGCSDGGGNVARPDGTPGIEPGIDAGAAPVPDAEQDSPLSYDVAMDEGAPQVDGAVLPRAKLLVLSDPHYFDPSLGTGGPAFAAYVARDRKLIAESDAIMRAMVAAVEAENPEAVLIPGDLTKDGERSSHDRVAAYLRQMQAGGRKVFVVPGNHDIENDGAESYAGDVATPAPAISAAEFATIYSGMGYAAALARDPSSLSYVGEITPGLWLLALDSCIYGDTRAAAASSGRLTAETRAWIGVQLAEAARRGARVLAMMHHGLVEHFTSQALVFPEYLVAERDAVAGLLSDGGVGAIFTGHFHANDITRGLPSASARAIYDIETGSTVNYPCPYRLVDVSADTLAISTKHVVDIDFDLHGAKDFQTYAHDSLRIGLEALIPQLLLESDYVLSDEEAAAISPWLADGLVAHYAGDEVMPATVPGEVQALLSSGDVVEMLAGMMLQSIWTDLRPADNTVVLDLSTR